MKNRVYLDKAKSFYKGNLHMHSTRSDGRCSPDAAVRTFKDMGYHFVSLTDHDLYTRSNEYDSEQFITIPGMERGELNPVAGKNPGYHFGAIDDPTVESGLDRYAHLQKLPTPIPWEGEHSPQELIDELRAHGNLVIFNHPEWHLTRLDDMVKYDRYFAIEIFNYATEKTPATSYGTAYWDHALQNGRKVYGIAADDSHGHQQGWKLPDYGGGWVQVQAGALTHVEIAKSLKAGRFYSSSGPEIYDIRVEDGTLRVECSPCRFIMFKAFPQRGPFMVDRQSAELMTSASMKILEDMHYIRIECIDAVGHVAWSNPVFVNELLE